MADLLSEDELESRLPSGWEKDGDEITRTYEFDDYLDGVEFVNEIAEIADEEFHHPEIIIGYKEVEVRLTSHEEGGITEKDTHLAGRFNDVQ